MKFHQKQRLKSIFEEKNFWLKFHTFGNINRYKIFRCLILSHYGSKHVITIVKNVLKTANF
jgi:hypothetical protein